MVEAYKTAYNIKPDATDAEVKKWAIGVFNRPAVKALIETLQQGVRYQFILMAPAAQERLRDLAETAKNERVKLDANLEILDRAGFKPPEKVEFAGVGIFGTASVEDVRDILRKNLENIEQELQTTPTVEVKN